MENEIIREFTDTPDDVCMNQTTIDVFEGLVKNTLDVVQQIFKKIQKPQPFILFHQMKLPRCYLGAPWGGGTSHDTQDPNRKNQEQKERWEEIKRITQHIENNMNLNLWDKNILEETSKAVPGGDANSPVTKKACVLQSIQQSILEKVNPMSDASEMMEAWYALGSLILSLSRGIKPLEYGDPLMTWILPLIGAFSSMVTKTITSYASVYHLGCISVDNVDDDFSSLPKEWKSKERKPHESFAEYLRLFTIPFATKYWETGSKYSHVPNRPGFFTGVAQQDLQVLEYSPSEAVFYQLIADGIRVCGKEKMETLIGTLMDVFLDVLLYHELKKDITDDDDAKPKRMEVNYYYAKIMQSFYEFTNKIEDKTTKDTLEFIIYMVFVAATRFTESLYRAVFVYDEVRFRTSLLKQCNIAVNVRAIYPDAHPPSRAVELFFELSCLPS